MKLRKAKKTHFQSGYPRKLNLREPPGAIATLRLMQPNVEER